MGISTFQLARNSPLRTTFIDETTGHAKYQIDTPIRMIGSVTRVRKFDLPPQSPLILNEKAPFDPSDDPTDKGKKKGRGFSWKNIVKAHLPETDDEIGRIHWKCFSTDKINFEGKATTRKEFLPRCGKRNRSYKFTGPDGVEYKWALGAMGMNIPRLVTTDGKKTEIAKFHRGSCFPGKRRKARLEVQPAGMGMLDHIIFTFVYTEQRRREREAAAKSGG